MSPEHDYDTYIDRQNRRMDFWFFLALIGIIACAVAFNNLSCEKKDKQQTEEKK